MESTKAWSSRACGLAATASDCRRASARNAGDRTSGTQIWIGRKPCARSRSRWLRTFTREGFGLDSDVISGWPGVTCNLCRAPPVDKALIAVNCQGPRQSSAALIFTNAKCRPKEEWRRLLLAASEGACRPPQGVRANPSRALEPARSMRPSASRVLSLKSANQNPRKYST